MIGPLDPLDKRLFGLRQRHRIVYKRERERRIGHLGTVGHLAHAQIVAHQHALLHRRSRDDIHLEEKDPDERCHDRRKDDCLDPLGGFTVGFVRTFALLVFFPEQAVHPLRDIDIVDHHDSQQKPQIPCPDDEPQQIQKRDDSEPDPPIRPNLLQSIHRCIHPLDRFIS